MERIGIHHYNADTLFEIALQCPSIEVEGVFSHFASADDPDLTFAAPVGTILRRPRVLYSPQSANAETAHREFSSHYGPARIAPSTLFDQASSYTALRPPPNPPTSKYVPYFHGEPKSSISRSLRQETQLATAVLGHQHIQPESSPSQSVMQMATGAHSPTKPKSSSTTTSITLSGESAWTKQWSTSAQQAPSTVTKQSSSAPRATTK